MDFVFRPTCCYISGRYFGLGVLDLWFMIRFDILFMIVSDYCFEVLRFEGFDFWVWNFRVGGLWIYGLWFKTVGFGFVASCRNFDLRV